jgi:hypothetical protein
MEGKQSTEILEEAPKKKFGGAQPGAGRKPGTTNKLSAVTILNEIEAKSNGLPYETILANDFLAARYSGDETLIHKWHQLILSKVIADKVDITSNGETIAAPTLNFAPKELPEYQVIDVTPTNEQS